jgi:hypothetical protein
MSDIIKVHDLPAIARYSSAVQEFSKSVDSASKQTMREFNEKAGKTGGSEDQGEAINAFFARLNTLQKQVFHEFPTTITHFSTALSTFEETTTAAGFQKEAWTQQTGNDSVYKKLDGVDSEQYEKIKTKVDNLQTLLNDATAELGIESEDLTAIKTTAGDDLASAATARRDTHNALQQAHDTLSKDTTEAEAELKNLQTKIKNASAICNIPAFSILKGIRNGSLTKNKISYLDSIQTEADGRALGALLSKQPGDILKEKPESLTEGFYNIGAQEMMEWIKSGDATTLNHLLDAMGNRDFSANQPFLLEFQKAGVRLGDALEKVMEVQYAKDGTVQSNQMAAYNKHLALTDKFVSLMESLYVMEIGKTKTTKGKLAVGDKLYVTETRTKVSISDISDATFSFKNTVDTENRTLEMNSGGYSYPTSISKKSETKIYKMEEYATAIGNNMAEKQARIGELEKSRKDATKNLGYTIAKGVGYSLLGVFAPEAVPIVSMIDSLATSDASKFTKQFSSMIDKNITVKGVELEGGFTKTFSYTFGVTLPIETIQSYLKYVDQLKGYDLEKEKTRISMVDDFLNRGNTYLFQKEGKSSVAVSRMKSHNFYTAARLKEMDDQGLVPYVEYAKSSDHYKVKGTVKESKEIIQKAIDKVNDETQNSVTSEMSKYLLGEETDLSLVNMTVDQLETYKNVLEELPISSDQNAKHGYEEYQLYLNSKYSGGAQ